MSLKCPRCGNKINVDWVAYSSSTGTYSCIGCRSLISWTEKYKRGYPAVLILLVVVVISLKSFLVDVGCFTEVGFVQNLFVLAGMVFLASFLKLALPLQRFIEITESTQK